MLFTALAFQSFENCLVLADYYWHTAAYARVCENKANLAMHCGGRCQMIKRMQTGQKEQEGPSNKSTAKDPIPWCAGETSFSIPQLAPASSPVHVLQLCLGQPADRTSSIFHPPPCLSFS